MIVIKQKVPLHEAKTVRIKSLWEVFTHKSNYKLLFEAVRTLEFYHLHYLWYQFCVSVSYKKSSEFLYYYYYYQSVSWWCKRSCSFLSDILQMRKRGTIRPWHIPIMKSNDLCLEDHNRLTFKHVHTQWDGGNILM